MKKIKTYKFRLYPSKIIERKLQFILNNCRCLYNTQLEYEKQIYFSNREYANRTDLNNLILDWKIINPNLKNIHSQVLQNVSDRLNKSFSNFFTRVKKGEKPGFPRFKSKDTYNSFTYPQSGFNLNKNKLKLSKIGEINIRAHRKINGKIKTLIIKKSPTNKWFAYFSVEETLIKKQSNNNYLGIDVGLNSFYTDSNGNKIENPKYLRESENRLIKIQRKFSKKKKSSKNRKKLRLKLAKLYEKILNQRLDFLHKQARELADNYSNIAVEKLQIKNMVKNHYLAKSINDVSWYKFLQLLSYKVEETGGQILEVNAKGTSQYCICGNKVKKSLAVRIHKCNKCGIKIDRDVMSAKLIKAIAFENYKINIQQVKKVEPKNTVGHTEFQACEVFPLGETVKQESLASNIIK